MKFTLRHTLILVAAVALLSLPLTLLRPETADARQQLFNEPAIKNLMNLGVAAPVSGKLLAGSIVDARAVVGASVQSTDNTLNSVSLDDEMLAPRGRGLLIATFGTLAANANAKDIKLKIGGTAICTLTDNTGNGTDFAMIAVVLKVATDSQIGFCWASVAGALVAASSIGFTATVDENVTMAIITTGDNNAAAASAATGKGLAVIPIG